jgi:hypothetical protein
MNYDTRAIRKKALKMAVKSFRDRAVIDSEIITRAKTFYDFIMNEEAKKADPRDFPNKY